MAQIALLILGFALLWKGGDFFVAGATEIARRLKISDFVIGLTLLALGTSAPELFVNVIATLQDKSDFVFGNILGSNISNLLLILGLAGLIVPLTVRRQSLKRELPFSLLCMLAFWIVLVVPLSQQMMVISRIEAAMLLLLFIAFLIVTLCQTDDGPEEFSVRSMSIRKALFFCVLGIGLLPIGGHYVVKAAIVLAQQFQVSEALIALFAVALGTSLPELATSVIAAKKGKSDMAVGNIIGSNIFNILFIIGISALVRPILFNPILMTEFWVIIAATLFFLGAMYWKRRYVLDRSEAMVMLLGYGVYLFFLFQRG